MVNFEHLVWIIYEPVFVTEKITMDQVTLIQNTAVYTEDQIWFYSVRTPDCFENYFKFLAQDKFFFVLQCNCLILWAILYLMKTNKALLKTVKINFADN